jgi:hypothetical protein
VTRRIVAVLALMLAACSSSQSRPGDTAATGDSAAPQPRRQASRDRNAITREELEANNVTAGSLYDYIVSRHSDWLRSAGGRFSGGATGARGISVYVDGQRYGSTPESARGIPISSVYLARRLSASEAAAKYGMDNNAGTIEVFTSAQAVR